MSDENFIIDPLNQIDANQDEESLNVEKEEEQLASEEPSQPELPEKYRGKSVEEIIEMHQNAEKALGSKNNEIGQWRSLTQQIIDAKAEADLSSTDEEEFELSSDDLFDNPKAAIAKVVERELQARLSPVEQRLQRDDMSRAEAQFLEAHSDAAEVTQSEGFQQWVQSNRYRQSDATRAAQGDLEAADRLLVEYKERAGSQPPQTEDKPGASTPSKGVEAARAVATERGGTSGNIASAKIYDASDLANMITRDPRKYNSAEFQSELVAAIKEGRVRGL